MIKWYNAAGAYIAKIKAGDKEGHNHYSNNSPQTVVTSEMVLAQVNHYNDPADEKGHLYGHHRFPSRLQIGQSDR